VPWAATSSVAFLWTTEGIVQAWLFNIVFAGGGVLALVTILRITGELRQSFLFFTPNHGMEAMLRGCSRMLMVWSVLFFVTLVGLYIGGSNLYECGKSSARITIGYLSGSAAIEWCIAVLSCIYGFVCAYSLLLFRHKARLEYSDGGHEDDAASVIETATSTYIKVAMVWLPIVLLLGIFPALYAISANVPGDNSFRENILALRRSDTTR